MIPRIDDRIKAIATGGFRVEVYDEDGELVAKQCKEAGDMILSNFEALLNGLLHGAGFASSGSAAIALFDTTNTNYNFNQIDFSKCSAEAAENDDSYGIQVGSGSTQPAFNDYKLGNQIKNDVLQYGACTYQDFGSPPNVKPGCSRKFTNNGSSNVSVSEIGLVVLIEGTQPGGNTGSCKCLMMHDVISTISVPAGGILNVEYFFNLNPSTS